MFPPTPFKFYTQTKARADPQPGRTGSHELLDPGSCDRTPAAQNPGVLFPLLAVPRAGSVEDSLAQDIWRSTAFVICSDLLIRTDTRVIRRVPDRSRSCQGQYATAFKMHQACEWGRAPSDSPELLKIGGRWQSKIQRWHIIFSFSLTAGCRASISLSHCPTCTGSAEALETTQCCIGAMWGL